MAVTPVIGSRTKAPYPPARIDIGRRFDRRSVGVYQRVLVPSPQQVTPAKGTFVRNLTAVRRLSTALGGAVLAAAVSACGGTVGGNATGADVARSIESFVSDAAKAAPTGGRTTTTPPASAAATTAAEQPPLTVAVAKTGWHEGFAITVEDATATENLGGAAVEMSLRYQNIGRTAGYVPRGSVQVAGAVGSTFDDIVSDEIPPGATGKGTITVGVDAQALDGTVDLQRAIDAVALVYGEQGDNRTLIPLAANQPVESVEPKDLTVGGSLSQSQVNIEVVDGRLLPSWESGEAGRLVIDLRIKVSCAADCRPSGYYADRDYFTLTDPAGTTLPTDAMRSGYCCEAIYPATIVQGTDLTLAFVVDEATAGTWTLTYEDPTVTAEGYPAGSLAFTV
jgi:hypothetical protein